MDRSTIISSTSSSVNIKKKKKNTLSDKPKLVDTENRLVVAEKGGRGRQMSKGGKRYKLPVIN